MGIDARNPFRRKRAIHRCRCAPTSSPSRISLLLCHAPNEPPSGYALCGHVHPGVRIAGEHDLAHLACFVLGRKRAAAGDGFPMVTRRADESIVAIACTWLFALPDFACRTGR